MFPLYIKNNAGIDLTLSPVASCGKLSILSFTSLNLPSYPSVTFSKTGVSFLQG
jgi:hypothetical protein